MRINPQPELLIRRGEAHLGSATGISTARGETKRLRKAFARALAALVLMVAAMIAGPAIRVFPGEPSSPAGKNLPNVGAEPKAAASPALSTMKAATEAVPWHISLHERIDRLIDAKLRRSCRGSLRPRQPPTPSSFDAPGSTWPA